MRKRVELCNANTLILNIIACALTPKVKSWMD